MEISKRNTNLNVVETKYLLLTIDRGMPIIVRNFGGQEGILYNVTVANCLFQGDFFDKKTAIELENLINNNREKTFWIPYYSKVRIVSVQIIVDLQQITFDSIQ